MTYTPDAALMELLKSVDTPTVCNSIEVAQKKRGFNDFTRGTLLASDPTGPAMCGFARTARIRAVEPSPDPVQVTREKRMAYYKYMAEAPTPSVAVVEDLDFPDCIGAYWGEVNTAIHKGFGLDGTLTNGVMRDLGDMEPGFPVFAASIGPSHGFVHVVDVDQPVTIFGLTVAPGDFVHADRHGAVIVPPDVLPVLGDAIHKMMECEQLVLGPAREPGFNFEKFEAAWAAFEKARV
ncbi:MAG: RraA family protein [Pseudomonadota bacterium]